MSHPLTIPEEKAKKALNKIMKKYKLKGWSCSLQRESCSVYLTGYKLKTPFSERIHCEWLEMQAKRDHLKEMIIKSATICEKWSDIFSLEDKPKKEENKNDSI